MSNEIETTNGVVEVNPETKTTKTKKENTMKEETKVLAAASEVEEVNPYATDDDEYEAMNSGSSPGRSGGPGKSGVGSWEHVRKLVCRFIEGKRTREGRTKITLGEVTQAVRDNAIYGWNTGWFTPVLDEEGKPVVDKKTEEAVLRGPLSFEEMKHLKASGLEIIVKSGRLSDPYRNTMNPLKSIFHSGTVKEGTVKEKPNKLPKGWIIRAIDMGEKNPSVTFIYKP